MRHLLEIDDLTANELTEVLRRSAAADLEPSLAGKGVALVFEKPSARTRNSGEMAVAFRFHPTSVADLISVSDAGALMPTKSTWFEPKLADGLVSLPLDRA